MLGCSRPECRNSHVCLSDFMGQFTFQCAYFLVLFYGTFLPYLVSSSKPQPKCHVLSEVFLGHNPSEVCLLLCPPVIQDVGPGKHGACLFCLLSLQDLLGCCFPLSLCPHGLRLSIDLKVKLTPGIHSEMLFQPSEHPLPILVGS